MTCERVLCRFDRSQWHKLNGLGVKWCRGRGSPTNLSYPIPMHCPGPVNKADLWIVLPANECVCASPVFAQHSNAWRACAGTIKLFVNNFWYLISCAHIHCYDCLAVITLKTLPRKIYQHRENSDVLISVENVLKNRPTKCFHWINLSWILKSG